MSEPSTTTYDEIPYGDHIFHYTRPDRLATMATLFGMQPAPVDRCRVLELGCGTGANLVPMALGLPGSTFLGLDLSPRQVEMGQEVVRALDLKNIDLRAQSILEVDRTLGEFDYIVCHGVYSWVPPEVQDSILRICKENIAPNGVAYVSYNTFPGWHLRAMVREMLRFHTGQFPEPEVRIAQARALLDFLIESSGDPDSVYGSILRKEAEVLGSTPDAYLYHEHLEEVNAPVYFHEFAARAAAKGLQYLCEAQPLPLPANLTPNARKTLERLATDRIHAEQYLDFVRNRMFRWTLLCHAGVPLQSPTAPPLRTMHITGIARPNTQEIDFGPNTALEFRNKKGTTLSTRNPLLKAALFCLSQKWPRAVPFVELLLATRSCLARVGYEAPAGEEGATELAEALLQCFLVELIDLHVYPPRFAADPSERPLASPLARYQAARGEMVTTLCHRALKLSGFERQILEFLDGTRDSEAVLAALVEAVVKGDVSLEQDGQLLTDADKARALMAPAVKPILEQMARQALLLG